MEVDILLAEIGSTTTMVNAFDNIKGKKTVFIGQGMAATSVEDGDVTLGLDKAVDDLKRKLKIEDLNWKEFMATSSAAGGLKMTVHGLVKDMTVKAAQEAALGAGAVIKQITVGKIKDYQINELMDKKPNIILLAGGVDYGEEETIIYNAKKLAELKLDIPVIYAGNAALHHEMKKIFSDSTLEVLITENVYPEIDNLNIEAARKLIHKIFARHIVRAPGMEKIEKLLSYEMMPTPGAVMESAKLLYKKLDNLMVVDIGGATTDIHSVSIDSPAVAKILMNPEPFAKRTVEGDLGVYINAEYVNKFLEEDCEAVDLTNLSPLPKNNKEEEIIKKLAGKAALMAAERHAGRFFDFYGPGGRQTVAEGKDLTAVKWIIGTGGALTRLQGGRHVLEKIKVKHSKRLLPGKDARILLDSDYIFASCGMLGQKYPEAALSLLTSSLKYKNRTEERMC
ncbi:MAG: GlmL-related ornithine degradation protein [Bacillota bacterium]